MFCLYIVDKRWQTPGLSPKLAKINRLSNLHRYIRFTFAFRIHSIVA